MRWIMASLVVINILVFIYFQLLPSYVAESGEAVSTSVNSPRTGRGIQLLGELGSPVGLQPGKPLSDPKTADVPVPRKPICTMVGSFDKMLQAEYFLERLLALGLSAEIRQIVVTGKPRYWLYLPPRASHKSALRRLNELQRRGIDSYIIPYGELENGISLGLFDKQGGAEVLQNKILEMGYRPAIKIVPREQKEIWVVLQQGEAAKLSPERWAELVLAKEYLQKRQNFCVDIAST